MTSDRVKGEDDPPVAAVNVTEAFAGKYKVTAKDGVSISFEGEKLDAAHGKTVELPGDVARALLNEGSIERA